MHPNIIQSKRGNRAIGQYVWNNLHVDPCIAEEQVVKYGGKVQQWSLIFAILRGPQHIQVN